MVYKYSGGRTAKEARWMIYGFCLCTTVLTVVSCWATGCGVRLIHSRYMKNNDWKEIQWRIGHSNIQLTTWIIFILQMFLLFNWSWKSVTEKITKFFFLSKKTIYRSTNPFKSFFLPICLDLFHYLRWHNGCLLLGSFTLRCFQLLAFLPGRLFNGSLLWRRVHLWVLRLRAVQVLLLRALDIRGH